MKRLTDDRTAAALAENARKLREMGFEIPIDDRRYIALSEFEREKERKERLFVSYDPDAEYYE